MLWNPDSCRRIKSAEQAASVDSDSQWLTACLILYFWEKEVKKPPKRSFQKYLSLTYLKGLTPLFLLKLKSRAWWWIVVQESNTIVLWIIRHNRVLTFRIQDFQRKRFYRPVLGVSDKRTRPHCCPCHPIRVNKESFDNMALSNGVRLGLCCIVLTFDGGNLRIRSRTMMSLSAFVCGCGKDEGLVRGVEPEQELSGLQPVNLEPRLGFCRTTPSTGRAKLS